MKKLNDDMWIVEPKKLESSFACYLNFLWKDDERPIYIMDNHLAALWCWLNNLSESEQYTLFHVDWHWDCAEMPDRYISDLKKIDQTSINEYLLLKSNDPEFPAVVWDNYIDPIIYLRPNLIKAHLTAHQINYNERIFDDLRVLKYEIVEQFFSQLNYNLNEAEGKIIFNLDLDFFFWSFTGNKVQSFSNEFAEALAKEIKPYLDENLILTIALSPECCGGWLNSLKICEVFCNYLDIEFPFSQIKALLK